MLGAPIRGRSAAASEAAPAGWSSACRAEAAAPQRVCAVPQAARLQRLKRRARTRQLAHAAALCRPCVPASGKSAAQRWPTVEQSRLPGAGANEPESPRDAARLAGRDGVLAAKRRAVCGWELGAGKTASWTENLVGKVTLVI